MDIYESIKANVKELDSFFEEMSSIMKNMYSFSVFEKHYLMKKQHFTYISTFFENEEKRKLHRVKRLPYAKKKSDMKDQPRMAREHQGINENFHCILELLQANIDLIRLYCKNPDRKDDSAFKTVPFCDNDNAELH